MSKEFIQDLVLGKKNKFVFFDSDSLPVGFQPSHDTIYFTKSAGNLENAQATGTSLEYKHYNSKGDISGQGTIQLSNLPGVPWDKLLPSIQDSSIQDNEEDEELLPKNNVSSSALKLSSAQEQAIKKAILKDQMAKENIAKERIVDEKATIDKFNQLIKVLNEINHFSQYALENQLRMFLDTLSPEELEAIIAFKDKFDKTLGGGYAWTTNADMVMTGVYILLTCTTLLAVGLGGPGGAAVISGSTYGFSNAAIEIALSFSWNVVDSVGTGMQAQHQFSAEKRGIARLNRISVVGMVVCSSIAVADFVKGNMQAAVDLCGWSFAFGMFFSASVEAWSWCRCSEHRNEFINELDKKQSDFKMGSNDIEDIKKITSFGMATNTIELVKKSGEILQRLKPTEPKNQNNKADWDKYYECEQRLDVIIRENAQANNHFRAMWSWIGCGIAMSAAAGALTFLATHTAGSSLFFTKVVSPWFNSCLGVASGFVRAAVGSLADDVAHANEAIKQRNEYLASVNSMKNSASQRSFVETMEDHVSSNLLEGGYSVFFSSPPELQKEKVIYIYQDEKKQLKYTVKWSSGEIKSGKLTEKDLPRESLDGSLKGIKAPTIYSILLNKTRAEGPVDMIQEEKTDLTELLSKRGDMVVNVNNISGRHAGASVASVTSLFSSNHSQTKKKQDTTFDSNSDSDTSRERGDSILLEK